VPDQVTEESLRLLLEVDEHWRKWQSKPPDVVYHYARANILGQVLESNRLWATLSTQLNDARELDHASDILRGVLKSRAASASVHSGELYPPSVTSFQYPRSDLVTTFVASLSATEDDLSQWCMYGDTFSGVALGFDSGSLVELDLIDHSAQPLGFFKVMYEESQQLQFFEWMVGEWERQVSIVWERDHPTDADARRHRLSLFAQLAAAGLSALPRMKARHFASENEWRLVHLHNRHRSCCPILNHGTRQHVALDLSQPGGKLPLVCVWLGASVANDESENLVRRLLSKHGHEKVSVKRSEIPLRGEPRRIAL